jgi:DNA-binding NtrC family response regulator
MAESPRILVVDPDPETTGAMATSLRDVDVRVTTVPGREMAEEELHHREYLAVVLDLDFEDGLGFALLKEIHSNYPLLPAIAISESRESGLAIEAVKAGAFDFLSKPIHASELTKAVRDAIACSRKSTETVAIDPGNELSDSADSLVGNSRAMVDVYKSLGRLSPTPVTVLIRGETGTGKELIARALYQHGHRSHKGLITVNCAAIPENLLESELFGHEKGAFTGAVSTRIGKFEQANGATLFLDEIGDLDLGLQAKLLRVLQEKRFQRVGGNEEISVDVRIIAATHRSLERMISEGSFREDLFYRLNVATIKLPPLRDRTGDIPLLSRFFLKRFGFELGIAPVSMTREAISRLESARLPGNVRQLQNMIRKALLRSRGYAIDREMIEELLVETEPPDEPGAGSESLDRFCRDLVDEAANDRITDAHQQAVEKVESTLLRIALDRTDGNISLASKWLGLSRLTIREKAKKYGIDRPGTRAD